MEHLLKQDGFNLVNQLTLSREQAELCNSTPTLRYMDLLVPAETLAKLIKKMMMHCAYEGERRGKKEYKNLQNAHAAIFYQLFKKLAVICNCDPVAEVLACCSCDDMSKIRLFLDPKLYQDWLDYVADHKDEVSCLDLRCNPSEWVSVLGVEVPKSLLCEAVGTEVSRLTEKCYMISEDAMMKNYPQPDCLSVLRRDAIVGYMLEIVLKGNKVRESESIYWKDSIEWTDEDWLEACKLFIINQQN